MKYQKLFSFITKKQKKDAPILSLDNHTLLTVLSHCFTKEEDILSLSLVCKTFRKTLNSVDVDFVPRAFPFPFIGCDGNPGKNLDVIIYLQNSMDYGLWNRLASITAEDCVDEFNLGKGFANEMRDELLPHIMSSFGADPITHKINPSFAIDADLPILKLHCKDIAEYVKWFNNAPAGLSKREKKDWPENSEVTDKSWSRWKQGLYALICRIHDETPIAFAVQCNNTDEESIYNMRKSSHHMSDLAIIRRSIIPAFSTLLDKSNFLEFSVFVTYFLVDPIFGKPSEDKTEFVARFFETMYKSCHYDIARVCKLKHLFRIMPEPMRRAIMDSVSSIFSKAIAIEDQMVSDAAAAADAREEEEFAASTAPKAKKGFSQLLSKKSKKNAILATPKRYVTVSLS